MEELKTKVTKSTDILLRAKDKGINLNDPIYAINWFATKAEWMYHFYNKLANKSVVKIGGKALFKGKVTETILDEYNGDRDLILIVQYPSGPQFMKLFESLYFKLVSLIRILAVKNFTFGFTHKQHFNESSQLEDGLHYALHHFKAEKISPEFFSDLSTLLNDHATIKYSGKMVAHLFSKEKNQPEEAIESIMDGLIILESESEEELRKIIQSEGYKKLTEPLDASYIGLLKRIL